MTLFIRQIFFISTPAKYICPCFSSIRSKHQTSHRCNKNIEATTRGKISTFCSGDSEENGPLSGCNANLMVTALDSRTLSPPKFLKSSFFSRGEGKEGDLLHVCLTYWCYILCFYK